MPAISSPVRTWEIDEMPPINGSENPPGVDEEKPDEELAKARATLDCLGSALKLDTATAFDEPVLRAMALVKHKDPGAWARCKTALQKAKVAVRDVEKALA